MKTYRIRLFAAGLLAVAFVLLASCGGSDNSVTGDILRANEDDGFTLIADPAAIVIDTTDPGAMVDPNSGLVYTQIILTASALDDMEVPQEGLEVSFASNSGNLDSEGNPVLTDADGNAVDTLTVYEDAPAQVEVTASDGMRIETIVLDVTLVLPNRPPVAEAGQDIVVECASPEGAAVTLDGSGSTDPDSTEGTNDDIVLYEWFLHFGTPEQVLLGEGMNLDVTLPLGTHTVTLQVTDSEGETAADTLTVEIVDTVLPTLSVALSPDLLWPVDHKMYDIHAEVIATDLCGDVSVILLSVTSNEPDEGLGDGDTANDIQGAELGTADFMFQLRAERQGPYPGRYYTAIYQAVDVSGNAAEAGSMVHVPHDLGEDE